MELKETKNHTNEKLKSINSNNKLRKLKSDFFLQKFFSLIPYIKSLEIIKYNKYIQKRIKISINNYKTYSEKFSLIELEIVPIKNDYSHPFIQINEEAMQYYHIYFNDNKKEEIKRTNLNEDDEVSKINIIIDYQIISFSELFIYCCIESINFKKFYRNNITDMSWMFAGCLSLKELNLINFKTNNVLI